MDERVEHNPAGEAIARENPREREGDGKRGKHRNAADLQRQRDNAPLRG